MKRWILILLMFAVIIGLVGWRLAAKTSEARMLADGRTAAAKAAPPVTVAPVVARDIVRTFTGVGTVEAPFSVKIAPKVSGRLDYLQVREGAVVKQGEVLARIDPSQIQAQLSGQEAAVAEAQARLAQAKLTQNPTNVNVASQIQQQTAALKSAKADEHQFQTTYDMLVAAGRAAVADAQGRINNATAVIANAEAGIRSAQANLNNAQIKYNRTYDLYKQGFVAAQDADDAKATLNVQQEALEVARGQLTSAQAVRDSAVQQKAAAEEQSKIGKTRAKADIESAGARVEQAVAALKYARSNTAQGPAYQQNIAALRSVVSAAQAQLRNMQSQLNDTILTSPISGLVVARMADPGAIVSPTQPIVTVQAIRSVFVTVNVPEDVNSLLQLGQSAAVTLDALPGRKFTGTITQMTPAADPQTRLFPLRITVDNRDNAIKPGSFARVGFVTRKTPGALVVPREAVQRSKKGTTVWAVDPEGIVSVRVVRTGAEDTNGIQILEGVKAGEMVVTLTNTRIKDGQKVRPEVSAGPHPDGDATK